MDDLISRQAAMSGIMDFMPAELKADATVEERVNYSAWCCALSCAEAFVRTMPPAEPKIGHWIKISPAGIYECSQCGQNVMTGDIEVYAYCHHCGAYMKEESNG